VVAVLLTLGGMALLIVGSMTFSSATTPQQTTGGMILLVLGAICLVIFVVLVFVRRNFLFPPEEPYRHATAIFLCSSLNQTKSEC
jgi:hypothetical protein